LVSSPVSTRNFELEKEVVVIAGRESGLGMGNGLFVLFPRESKQSHKRGIENECI
jgi:hypothetical protein